MEDNTSDLVERTMRLKDILIAVFEGESNKSVAFAFGYVLGKLDLECGIPSEEMIDKIRDVANRYKEDFGKKDD